MQKKISRTVQGRHYFACPPCLVWTQLPLLRLLLAPSCLNGTVQPYTQQCTRLKVTAAPQELAYLCQMLVDSLSQLVVAPLLLLDSGGPCIPEELGRGQVLPSIISFRPSSIVPPAYLHSGSLWSCFLGCPQGTVYSLFGSPSHHRLCCSSFRAQIEILQVGLERVAFWSVYSSTWLTPGKPKQAIQP